MKKGLLISSYLYFFTTSLFASGSSGVGTASAQFLKLGSSARAIGMGEAYSSVASDADSIFWNPAGLGMLERKSLSVMHSAYLNSFFYDFGSYAHPHSKLGTMGLSVQHLSSNKIDITDDFGADAGTFRMQELAITVGYGKVMKVENTQKIAMGFSVKYIRSKIIETTGTGAADFGILWLPMDKMRFELAIQNLGGKLKY